MFLKLQFKLRVINFFLAQIDRLEFIFKKTLLNCFNIFISKIIFF